MQRTAACWVCGSKWNSHTHDHAVQIFLRLFTGFKMVFTAFLIILYYSPSTVNRGPFPFNSHYKFPSNSTRSHSLYTRTAIDFNKFVIFSDLSTRSNFENHQFKLFPAGLHCFPFNIIQCNHLHYNPLPYIL